MAAAAIEARIVFTRQHWRADGTNQRQYGGEES
jgi:hypothetical protein